MKNQDAALVSRFARLGAAVRLRQIDEEAAAIRKLFPRLDGATASPAATASLGQSGAQAPRERRGMSPEAREAARQRMKAYWAKKRQENSAAARPEKVEASERVARPRRRAARRRRAAATKRR